MITQKGWIGVDFDGTLARHDGKTGDSLGAPVPSMLARILGWMKAGYEVRIVTARAFPLVHITPDQSLPRFRFSLGCDNEQHKHAVESVYAIRDWCKTHLGRVLTVTCAKDYEMIELWDDRAVQVIPNTGKRVDGCGEVLIR